MTIATDLEIGAGLGDMHHEWQQTDTKVKVKKTKAPKPDKLEPWSETDELAFQMGDMHGVAFVAGEEA